MDYNSWIFTLILLMFYSLWGYAASQELQSPNNVTAVIQDGEVTLVWAPPAGAPPQAYYKVQLAKYTKQSNWTTVPGCEQVQSTHCQLTDFTTSIDYYRAQVQMAKEDMTSKWSKSKMFCRTDGQLLPPTFTLTSSSTSVKVRVHRKPALKDVYRHGLLYKYYLQEKGQDNMVNKSVLWVRDKAEEEKDVEFDFLTWGLVYCVHLKVEHNTGTAISESSSECILLPQPEWYILTIVVALSLSGLGVVGLLSLLLHCFLWRPKKLPSTLISPRSAWHPLSLGEVPVEKVTDQGWFLYSREKSGELGEKRKVMEGDEGVTRKGSVDSGMSVDRPPSERGGGREGDGGGERRKQEDSGCGSLGGADGDSCGGRRVSEERPLLDGRNTGRDPPQKADSGLGLGCQYNGGEILQVEDCRRLCVEEVETGDGYRRQRPSFVVVQEIEKGGKLSDGITGETDSSVAITVGYRPSQLSCVCLGKGLCLWCQSVAPLPTKEHSLCSYPAVDHSDQFPASSITCFPDSYLRKSHLHNGGDLMCRDTPSVCHVLQTESRESVPLFISVPQLPLACGGLDSSVNALSLALQDVELTFG